MARIVCTLIATLVLLIPKIALADSQLSVGAGIGAMYSGLGVNVSLYRADDIKFMSVGCIAYGRDSNGSHSACGPGVGWLKIGIFGSNDKHALGLYVGAVSVGIPPNRKGNEIDTVYGISMPYVFFFNGARNQGFNLGIAPAIGRYKDDTKGSLLLQIGYQF